jgi:hypothetical protein
LVVEGIGALMLQMLPLISDIGIAVVGIAVVGIAACTLSEHTLGHQGLGDVINPAKFCSYVSNLLNRSEDTRAQHL